MESKKKKNNVFIKTSDAFTCWDLPDERFAKLIRAVIMYNYDGTTPDELDPELATMFKFFKTTTDNYNDKYEETCERNRQSANKGGGNPNFKKGHPNPYYERDNRTLAEITEDNQEITDINEINEDNQEITDINEINLKDRIGLDRIGEDNTFSNEKDIDIEKPSPIGDEKKSPQKRGFVKPTIDEIRDYCDGKGYGFDPEAFVAFYESNGWRVSRNPMRDWKMACVTWQKRFEEDRRREEERRSRYGRDRASPPSPPPERVLYKSPYPDISDEEWDRMGPDGRSEVIHARN